MRELGSGTIYFDTTNTWLPPEGLFIDDVGKEAHEDFAHTLAVASENDAIGQHDFHQIVNKLVSNHGLAVVSLSSDGRVSIISKNKRLSLSPEQIGRIEDTFGLGPSDTVEWTDAINGSGSPVRRRELLAQSAIFGGFEYRSGANKSGEDHEKDDSDMQKFLKTVRPEPSVKGVEDPNKGVSRPSQSHSQSIHQIKGRPGNDKVAPGAKVTIV